MQSLVRRTAFSLRNTLRIVYAENKGFADKFKDKENAEERLFMDKEERKTIKRLLQKLEAEGKTVAREEVSMKDEDLDAVKIVLERHRVKPTEALLEELYDWKYRN